MLSYFPRQKNANILTFCQEEEVYEDNLYSVVGYSFLWVEKFQGMIRVHVNKAVDVISFLFSSPCCCVLVDTHVDVFRKLRK